MSIDGWRSSLAALSVRLSSLERDWQSVLVSVVIVAIVGAFEVQIPW